MRSRCTPGRFGNLPGQPARIHRRRQPAHPGVLATRRLTTGENVINTLSLGQIVIDSADAAALAGFWSRLLDRPLIDGANQYFAVIPRSEDGAFPALMFLAVPEPRQGKNRLHLDLVSADRTAAVERAVQLGARKVGSSTSTGRSGPRWPTRRATSSTSVSPLRTRPSLPPLDPAPFCRRCVLCRGCSDV